MSTPSVPPPYPCCADSFAGAAESSDGHELPVEKEAAREVRDQLLRLAVIAAHQLKSPLASIQTNLSLLIGGFMGPISVRQRDLLEGAAKSATRGTELVTDLLRLRGLDVLSSEDLTPVNLLDTFRAGVDRARGRPEAQEVQFFDLVKVEDPLLLWVNAEPRLLEEIFQVLMDNAVKYTPAGGRVSARLMIPDEPWDLPGAPPASPQAVLEVTDSGIGIPPSAFGELFTEFFRASNARKMSKEGTGLGLAFAERAVRLLKGRLRIEPAKTGGVRALVILPLMSPDECKRLAHRQQDGEGEPEGHSPRSQRVVVIGGVAAGSKAAARIMRLDPAADVTVVERGRVLSYAGCGLPYYISGAVRDQRDLLSSPLGEVRDSSFFHAQKNVRTLDLTEAIAIDREQRKVTVRWLVGGREDVLPYDHLVVATGARAALPPVPGLELAGVYTLHGVEDAEAIRNELTASRAKEVVIVGGGLLGCEITESMALRGARISLVEEKPSLLGIVDPELAARVERHLESRGVRVFTGYSVAALEGSGRVEAVRLQDRRRLPCDFVILATGVRPETALARQAGLAIGPSGAIQVDRCQRSSDPRIFAVGDCSETVHLLTGQPTWFPMGSTALKQGRVAAANICGRHEEFPGVVGSMLLKVFDYTVSTTGLSEADARAAGFDPITAIVSGPDRAHYLPTANPILLKMVADRDSRRLLGLQGVGTGDVATRIDIVATALSAGMTLDSFAQLDLPYAPPYSLALDHVLTAANVLRNKLDGLFHGITPADLQTRLQSDAPPLLLDIRLPAEYGALRLPGCRHIPLGALRGRLHELPKDASIVTIGKIGLRSYEAALLLTHYGFQDVSVLDGGLDAWPYALERL